jgi:L-seryl-tRNA(Ser) seleniumtransferase
LARVRAAGVGDVLGGTLPDPPLPTWVVEVEAAEVGDAELAHRLRTGRPAVLGRLRDGKLVLDLRTIFPAQEGDLIDALAAALWSPPPDPPEQP